MTTATQLVCPQCRRADRIQKVTGIIDAGTLSSEIYKTDSPFAQGYTEGSTNLATRLKFPNVTAAYGKRPIEPGYIAAILIFVLLLFGFMGVGILVRIMQGTAKPEYPGAIWVLAAMFASLLLGLYLLYHLLKDRVKMRQQTQEKWEIYDDAVAQDQQARNRWQNELYYCFRDDCIFILGQERAVPPESMQLLLYD
jgi:hypothetical protein